MMDNFSNADYTDIHVVLGQAESNAILDTST